MSPRGCSLKGMRSSDSTTSLAITTYGSKKPASPSGKENGALLRENRPRRRCRDGRSLQAACLLEGRPPRGARRGAIFFESPAHPHRQQRNAARSISSKVAVIRVSNTWCSPRRARCMVSTVRCPSRRITGSITPSRSTPPPSAPASSWTTTTPSFSGFRSRRYDSSRATGRGVDRICR